MKSPAALLLACLLLPGMAGAQASPDRHTGDAWVDARLADIDVYAATYRDAFVDEMARYHRAPREFVLELLARPGWTAGDVYYACSLAQQAGRPCRAVADLRGATPTPGWDTLAHDLGLMPGSPGFHALKREVVTTYDRWARPVRVDAELARDFPQRPREADKPAK
ncbi:hypothetical protein DWG18_12040 [Lysobacter sp. TY2-98]|uniref:hypothetical protein n=1 Tax=Lysobacter sp. TY2-98 TaxID=2290922 RepID=UPI000E1FCA4D|nr:hypothetical protein [Lysobacter sp. TY2-98]AXK72935.1 hypothetical protein DWG18_12040 [Lysobacter sp. TY2-98]